MGKASNSKTENKRLSHHEKRVHWIKPVIHLLSILLFVCFCFLNVGSNHKINND